jgi:pimeloyl-ACP methyl ester carboxylesterase
MLNLIHHPVIETALYPPLVIAHGLFGTGRNWGVIARRLSQTRQVVAVDMRNHGDSPWMDSHNYPDMAADLAQVIGSLGAPVDLLGHSMGGKAAMQLALTMTEPQIRRLVVADIAPVAYSHDQSRHIHAMRALDTTNLANRSEADLRLSELIPDPALRAFFLQSLDLRAEGGPRWRLNLDVLEAWMDKIVGWPDTAGQFTGPTLFLTGADSYYVQPEHRETMKTLFPAARFAKIPDTGHWLHAERPREFEAAVEVFLNR